MSKRGPWSRVNALREGWPAAAFFQVRPVNRVPHPDDMAADVAAAIASGKPAEFGGVAERKALAMSLGIVGRAGRPTDLSRVWAATWSLDNDLSRRIVAAGTALAADGIPLLLLLASCGGAGAAGNVAADMAHKCEVLATKTGLRPELRQRMRELARGLRENASSHRGASAMLRYRVGWLSYFGITKPRMYGGWIRADHEDPGNLVFATNTMLSFCPPWALYSPHLHLPTWLATRGSREIPAEVRPQDLEPLLDQATQLIPELPMREMSLFLAALAAKADLPAAEPIAYYRALQKLPTSGGPFCSRPRGKNLVVSRDPGHPSSGAVPEDLVATEALWSCAQLLPPSLLVSAEIPLGIRETLIRAHQLLKQR